MSPLSRLVLLAFGVGALFAAAAAHAETKGENYSDKPPSALFESDCTDSGCHNGPRGLAKGRSASDLTDYLKEHYTNSRQSAAALANYLRGVPGANDTRQGRDAGSRDTPARNAARRETPASPEPKKDDSTPSWLPSLPSLFSPSSPSEEATKHDETKPEPKSRAGRRDASKPKDEDEANPAPRTRETKRQPPKTEAKPEPKTEDSTPSWLPSFLSPSPPAETAKHDDSKPQTRSKPSRRDSAKPKSEDETNPAPRTREIGRASCRERVSSVV